MKKILFYLLLTLPFLITACSDDDDNVPKELKDSLKGTRWETQHYDPYNDDNFTETIYFVTETKVEISYSDDDEIAEGTYTYNSPNVKIITPLATVSGKINGNKMELTFEGESLTYTRK